MSEIKNREPTKPGSSRVSSMARFDVATETDITQEEAFFVLLYNTVSATSLLFSCISHINLLPVFIATIAVHGESIFAQKKVGTCYT